MSSTKPPKPTAQPTVALVYDWVTTGFGGAELVLQELHRLFPRAPLFTTVYDQEQARWAREIEVRPSWLQRLPWAIKHYRLLAPLMPLAFESFNLDNYDIVISVTSAHAKGVLTKPNQLHLCYLLTPPRYLYTHETTYRKILPLAAQIGQILLKPIYRYLRWWDQTSALRPDVLIPISQRVAQRASSFYQRKTAPVIYPPLPPLERKLNPATPNQFSQLKPYYLVVSRLVAYKQIELAIRACVHLERNLVIVGEGPEKNDLQNLAHQLLAGKSARCLFLSRLSDQTLTQAYQSATALLLPAEEDFGIAATTALSLGVPSILHQQSGAAEIIKNETMGLYLTEASVPTIVAAMRKLETKQFDAAIMIDAAKRCRSQVFRKRFAAVVATNWKKIYEST